jgi:hypothetical protein
MRRPFYGPKLAGWHTIIGGRCTGSYSHTADRCAAAVVSEALEQGREAVLERTEYCPHPFCSGGQIVRQKRGRMFPDRSPCPQCAAGLGCVAVR